MDSSSGTSPGKTAFSTGQPLEARQPERYDKESDQMKNGIMMQYFEWNLPNDGQFWNKLKEDAPTWRKWVLRPSGFLQPAKGRNKMT